MLSRITDFKIKPLNINELPLEIFIFAENCKAQNIKNNESIEAMKLGKWKNENWWTTWVNDQIVSISGCHQFSEYKENCWRLMVRTATLKEFRGKAPGNFRQIKNDFNWGFILPYQIDYAKSQGAKTLVFTTNSDLNGDFNSLRTDKTIRTILEPQGLVKLIDENVNIFYTKQNVWEIIV